MNKLGFYADGKDITEEVAIIAKTTAEQMAKKNLDITELKWVLTAVEKVVTVNTLVKTID